jgi:hypothetical protein
MLMQNVTVKMASMVHYAKCATPANVTAKAQQVARSKATAAQRSVEHAIVLKDTQAHDANIRIRRLVMAMVWLKTMARASVLSHFMAQSAQLNVLWRAHATATRPSAILMDLAIVPTHGMAHRHAMHVALAITLTKEPIPSLAIDAASTIAMSLEARTQNRRATT